MVSKPSKATLWDLVMLKEHKSAVILVYVSCATESQTSDILSWYSPFLHGKLAPFSHLVQKFGTFEVILSINKWTKMKKNDTNMIVIIQTLP